MILQRDDAFPTAKGKYSQVRQNSGTIVCSSCRRGVGNSLKVYSNKSTLVGR
jgi:hypothetical protein